MCVKRDQKEQINNRVYSQSNLYNHFLPFQQMSGKNLNPTVFKSKDPSTSTTSSTTTSSFPTSSKRTFASFLQPVGIQDDWLSSSSNSKTIPTTNLSDRPKEEEAKESNATSNSRDGVTSQEIFDIIRRINDPEHPLTLEQLNVVQIDLIQVDDARSRIKVNFTPTIPHCSMATLIGLSITTKLIRSLPIRFKISVNITPGTHNQESEVNKQLNDKERVAAALENSHLLQVVDQCIANTDGGDDTKKDS